jgi:hypothetical protein
MAQAIRRALLDIARRMIYAMHMALAIRRANLPIPLRSFAACALSWLCAGALLVACGGGDDDDNDNDSASTANAVLEDQNNYTSETKLSLGTVEVAAGEDIDVCWGEVTSDLLCHEVNPEADLDHVSLIRFKNESESEVEAQLAAGELNPVTDIDAYFEFDTAGADATCKKLSRMHSLGDTDGSLDIEEQFTASDSFTYVLLVAEGDSAGVGTRSMTFVKPTSSADATTVEIPAACSDSGNILDFSANLKSAKKVTIPADGPWVVDWSGMKHDGTGNSIDFGSIDSLLIGFYEGMTVDEIQSQVKDIELIATTLWELEIKSGKSADLADARERTASGKAGDRFAGFTSTDGVWLIALMCSTCQSPAPLVLAVLEPQGAE